MEKWMLYEIIDLTNGHTYIGQHKYKNEKLNDGYMGSSSILNGHYRKLKNGTKKWMKGLYEIRGMDSFRKKILLTNIPTQRKANTLEILFILEAKQRGKAEYNLSNGGDSGNFMNSMCHPRSEETKKKISEKLKGRKFSKERIERQKERLKLTGSNRKGAVLSEETKRKISENSSHHPGWNKGKKMSKEFIESQRESYKKRADSRKNSVFCSNGVETNYFKKDQIPSGFYRVHQDGSKYIEGARRGRGVPGPGRGWHGSHNLKKNNKDETNSM